MSTLELDDDEWDEIQVCLLSQLTPTGVRAKS